jgi:hypothetical protein
MHFIEDELFLLETNPPQLSVGTTVVINMYLERCFPQHAELPFLVASFGRMISE